MAACQMLAWPSLQVSQVWSVRVIVDLLVWVWSFSRRRVDN
ncbi:hypothetical protein QEH34_gp65 [Microbacterium phage Footloose]|uniref:Uncharacterized protein n=1 Tax=Microbacterium phage Footloose TaxID=2836048 RepID=A0A8F3E9I7_9CAUD|nr:hypothetical protein QEH34_gp65 [Microbacterium phage Footloose]QWY84649.1 hypothetical protein SEA_FOOTLOOSE_70 [Microbacterium phage Footloose]